MKSNHLWWRNLLICISSASMFLFSHRTTASTFITHGAEVKGAAGAGTTHSRGPAAIFYNPANLILSAGVEPYTELTLLHFDYSYTYPGYDPAKIEVTAPLIYGGLNYKINSKFAVALTFIPIPKEATQFEVKNLPTREVSEEPVLVDVEAEGKNLGYLAGFGFAYRPQGNMTFGLSLRQSKESLKINAIAPDEQIIIYQIEQEKVVTTAVLGSRFSLFHHALIIGLAYKPPATVDQDQRERIGETGEWEEQSGKTKEFSTYSLGVEYRFAGITPWFELTHEDHEVSRSNPKGELDTYKVTNYIFGTKYRLSKFHEFGFAYGRFPSHVGNGLMKERSSENVELIGLRFGEVDAIGRSVYATSYAHKTAWGRMFLAGAYHSGTQVVDEEGRGYGDYSIKVYNLSLGVAASY